MFSLSLQWLVLALDTSLKAALLALLAAAALRARKLRDSNVRHRVWTSVLLGMLVLPVLARMIPALRLPLPLNLDRLTAFQLDDLDSPPAADPASTPNSTAEIPATLFGNEPSNQSHNSLDAWPQDPRRPSRDLPWAIGSEQHARNNSRPLSPDEFTTAGLSSQGNVGGSIVDPQSGAPPAPRPRQRPIALSVIAIVAVIWLIGSAAFLLRLAVGLLLALRLVRRSTPINDNRIPTSVRECSLIHAPLTVGLLRPHVLLPPAWRMWSPPQLSAVLAHEQMHVERGDCFVLLLAQINLCFYWFHPLAWWLPQHLASLAEAACDDAVIGSTGDRTAYARHLLDVAAAASLHGGRLAPLGVSMARRCEVETRIHAILDFRRPLSQRLSWTTAILLAAAIVPLIALAAALQPSTGEQDKPAQTARKEPDAAEKKDAAPAQPDAPASAAKSPLAITGSILNAQGQPIPDASIHILPQFAWLESSRKQSPRFVAKSDNTGRFEFTPQPDEADKSSGAKLLIVAPNFGPEFLPLAEVAEQPNIKISLAADDTPIRGRILTLEGQPVADAKISVKSIRGLKSGDLQPYIDIVKAGNGINFNFDKNLYQPPHIDATTTDADGRFQLQGIGPNRVAELEVVSRTIQHALLNVMTVESEPLKPRPGRGFADLEKSHPPIFGATFDWVAKPSRTIIGTVVDAKTRQPLAGVGVGTLDEAHTKTDENGRFELLGCAKATSYGLLLGADSQQYLNGSARIVDTPGFEPIEVTLELTRGTTISGRIIDQATQKPIDHAQLRYFPLSPNARVVPGIGGSEARVMGAYAEGYSSPGGEFSIAVLPGPGCIGITAPKSVNYQPATVDAVAFFKKENVPYAVDAPQGLRKTSLLLASPNGGTSAMPVGQFNWVELLNTADQAELKLSHDIALIEAKNLAGIVLGPDGQPLTGAIVHGLAGDFVRDAQTLRTSDFTVTRLAPDEKRTLIFRHDAQKLAGQLEISADSPQPARITLQPWADVTGRLLDKDGSPLANLEIGPWGELKDGETRGHLPGHHSTDDQGRFRLTGLVPGLVYPLTAHNTTKPPQVRIRLKPGEILDLGDIPSTHEHLSLNTPLPPGEGADRRSAGEGLAGAAMSAPSAALASATANNAIAPAPTPTNSSRSAPLKGRVVSASGKAVAGAKIYWFWSRTPDLMPMKPRLLATTNAKGEFNFTLPAVADQAQRLAGTARDYLVIIAAGHGVAVEDPESLHSQPAQPQSILGSLFKAVAGSAGPTIRLPAAGEPIRGRLVNIDGQPVAGATVKIRWFDDIRPVSTWNLNATAADEKAAWPERVISLLNSIEPVQLPDVLPTAKTDAAGRFELRDVGANRLFQLLIQNENTQTVDLAVRNQVGQPITIPADHRTLDTETTLHPRDFTYVLGPSKPLTGRVLDLDSGEPIAGAVVRAYQIHGNRLNSSRGREAFATTTDNQGRYRLTGLPVGSDNHLVAFTTGDIPYIPVGHQIDTSKGENAQQDFRLKRGVWATGRVFDAETNEPFPGQISYYWFPNKELEKQIPGLFQALVDEVYWTDNNGEFRLPVLPSRGILAFRHSGRAVTAHDGMNRFPRGAGADEITGSEKMGSMPAFPTLPHYLMPTNYQRVAEVNPAPGQESIRVDLPLVASRPFQIRVVDSDGKPVPGCEVHGACERWGWQNMTTAEFPVEDLRPKEKRKVLAFHRDRGLAGGVIIQSGDSQPVEIKLAPAGTLSGRLLDDDGQPMTDATLLPNLEEFADNDFAAVWADDPNLHYQPSNIPLDKDGRFRLTGIIPGWHYTAHASAPRKLNGDTTDLILGSAFRHIRIQLGEQKDLGDLRVKTDDDTPTQSASEGSPLPPGEHADGHRREAVVVSAGEGLPVSSPPPPLSPSPPPVDSPATPAPSEKPQTESKPAPAEMKPESSTPIGRAINAALTWLEKSPPPQTKKQPRTLKGRIIDEAGQPLEGVVIRMQPNSRVPLDSLADLTQPPRAVTAADGRFAADIAGEERGYGLLAYRPRFGLAYIFRFADDETDFDEIVLHPERPLTGRLIDTEGRPVAGAHVAIKYVYEPKGTGNLDPFLAGYKQDESEAREAAVSNPILGNYLPEATTDAEGRFTIPGTPAEFCFVVEISAPGFGHSTLWVINRAGFDPAPYNDAREPWRRNWTPPLVANPLNHVCVRDLKVTGRVLSDNGRPLVGIGVRPEVGTWPASPVFSDKQGAFTVSGLPGGKPSYIAIEPNDDRLIAQRIQLKPSADQAQFNLDITLRPGVKISGRITDPVTSKGVPGWVSYHPLLENENAKQPGYDNAYFMRQSVGDTGYYSIMVMPGPGVLTVQALASGPMFAGDKLQIYRSARFSAEDRTRITITNEKQQSYLGPGRTVHWLTSEHAVQYVNPPAGRAQTLNFQLDRGKTVDVEFVDAAGQPVENVFISGHTEHDTTQLTRPRTTILALSPATPRKIVGVHEARGLIGSATVTGNERSPVRITLGPSASFRGRAIDEHGQPLANQQLLINFDDDDSVRYLYYHLPEQKWTVTTDADGRFAMQHTAPGERFRLAMKTDNVWLEPALTAEQTVLQPGQNVDFGNVVFLPEGRKMVKPPPASGQANRSEPAPVVVSSVSDTKQQADGGTTKPAAQTTVTGSVLLPNSQPAPAAHIFAVHTIRSDHGQILSTKIIARTATAADGKFQISLASQPERAVGNAGIESHTQQLIATAPGYGLAWQPVPAKPDSKPLTLQLVPDSTPLEGRILNLEGQPVAGARLRVMEILEPTTAALDNWLAAVSKGPATAPRRMTKASSFMRASDNATPFPGGKIIFPPSLPNLAEVKTDSDGRFRIAGLGPNRKVTLLMDGPSVATSWIATLTRDIAPVPLTYADPRYRIPYILGAKFDFAAEPTQIIAGTVRDADTHKPLAGVGVFPRRLGGSTFNVDGFASAKTDDAGRYQLTGLPKPPAGESDVLYVVPDKSQPYFRTEIDVPAAAGLAPVTCDIDVKAAAWLTGRVTEKQSGSGVASVVSYYPYLNNPHATKYPNFDSGMQSIGQDDLVATDAEGNFRIPALPGRGVVLATALDARAYRLAAGAAEAGFPSRTSTEQRRTVYHLFSPDVANSVRSVEIDPAATESSANVELVPLARATIKVLDDKNQPLNGAQVIGVYPTSAHNTTEQFGTVQPLTGDTADIYGLDLDGRRLVLLLHRDLRLAKAVLAEDQKSAVAQLEPCATITGRLLDAQGKPIANQRFTVRVAEPDSPQPKDNRAWGRIPFFVQSQNSDADGNFKLDLIVPGVGYRIESAGGLTRDIPAVASGQTIDLGNLTPPPPQEK